MSHPLPNFRTPAVVRPDLTFSAPWQRWLGLLSDEVNTLESAAGILSGTYAARPSATGQTDGTLYYAANQTVTYIAISGAWVYFSGTMRGTINPDQKPTLVAADAGFLFYSTDFAHTYRWTGTAWEYAPGDDGSGYVAFYTVAPPAGIWQACDGTASVYRSLANGTRALVAFSSLAAGTVPDWNGGEFVRMGAAVTGAVVAESNTLVTGVASAGTNTNVDVTVPTEPMPRTDHFHAVTGTIIPAHGALLAYLRL